MDDTLKHMAASTPSTVNNESESVVAQPITRVLVTGSRLLTSDDVDMSDFFGRFVKEGHRYVLVHGCAQGADSLAAAEAKRRPHQFDVQGHKPNWYVHGKFIRSAGHIRNAEMIKTMPRIVIAFLRGPSSGTKSCLKLVARCKSVELVYLWDEGNVLVLDRHQLHEHMTTRT